MPQRPRRTRAGLVVGAVLLATAGCTPLTLPAPEEEAQLFPGVEEAVNASLGRVEPPTVERLNFRTGPATATFGRREVARGYAEAVWFATATSFTLQTLDSRYHSIGAFTRHTSHMTPEFADEVDQLAWECFDGDEQSCSWLGAMRVYGLESNGFTLQEDGPLVVDHVIHEAEVWVDDWSDEPTLGVRFEEQASVRMTKAGENWLVPVVKDADYWLVPGPEADDVTWRVADVDSWYVVEGAVPDTGTY